MRGAALPVCALAMALVTACSPGAPTPEAAGPEELLDPVAHQETLEGMAFVLGLEGQDLPGVEVRRVVDPPHQEAAVTECMAEEGYLKGPDGTWPGISVEQRDIFTTALYVCHAAYPVPSVYTQAWDEEQKQAMYRYTTDSLVPCLEEEGYAVPEAPSQEVFVDSWDLQPWYAHGQADLSGLDQQELVELNSRCPQTPPLHLLQD